ncbi:glutamate--tRNA ligase [Williamwhitmania taraxaci]|uniref:Glutamate--tRNA ligase n=1 Tax=Williamwhitmania taraxaci TaxID=1640674 RepID=A0A1G6MZC5_9BACT|nr:glutamate--tRNA ligase [Williamwhitmania taraxaci]SDC60771.1 glutamyl-tRNA synthetase [Williamwhitmania taraxaci]
MKQRRVRVRFAPSPTGPLHIGGVRTALFNYFFAKKHGGDFLLRIEDTDSNRFVPGAEDYIVNSLKWCGIQIDEGVSVGGPHAPYRQSERRDIYKKYADQLVAGGFAYYAFDTPEELDAIRAKFEAEGKTFTYNFEIRTQLNTSLVLPAEEVQSRINTGQGWVIRFKMPENEEVEMHDLIRDRVVVNSSTLDDKVLFKSADMLPTYHLANVVDDYLMEISHVIRGEEWLPSLPLHVLLYRAFGWTEVMPLFSHLPLLLKPTGNGKLSKRDGDKLGFPVFPLFWKAENGETARGYREDGYFPEAFVNLLAFLGWNPGTEQELFTMDELIQLFSLERVNKSGARFDPEKAKWFNQQYLRMKSDAELATLYMPILEEKGISVQTEYVESVVALVKDRATFMSDFWPSSSYFFVAPDSYDEKVVAKFWKENIPALISELRERVAIIAPFSQENIDKVVHEWVAEKQVPMGQVMNNFRLCLVGASMGPGVAQIAALIGKEETLKRLDAGIKNIKA